MCIAAVRMRRLTGERCGGVVHCGRGMQSAFCGSRRESQLLTKIIYEALESENF